MNLLCSSLRIKKFLYIISTLLVTLSSGCGGGSDMSFSNSDTKEGEEFIKHAEEGWNEIRLISTAQYWREKGEPFDAQKIKDKILEIQTKTTEDFKNLLTKKKISLSQYERYMKILGGVSNQ